MKMDEFNPDKKYRPEDEYEALEPQKPEPVTAPEQTAPSPAPAQAPAVNTQAPVSGAIPVQQPVPPVQQPMQYAAPGYRQPKYAQPIQQPGAYAQPVQRPVSYAQPVQPVQQGIPYPDSRYPQQYAQPVQQPVYQPIQQAPLQQPVQPQAAAQPAFQQTPAQQPVQNDLPLSPNPYIQNYSRQPQPAPVQPKPATPTGTKVFIIILCALLAAMVIGFVVYIASSAKGNNQSKPAPDNSSSSIDNGDDNDSESDLFNGIFNNNSVGSYTEVEDEITLKADNGDTQKRTDDNKNSVGTPDENAKNITLEPLPKDKDDAKYTTQYAYETVSDSVVTVICYEDEITDSEDDIVSQGSGTIISEDGYLITNAHVIGNSRAFAINIALNNGKKYPAKVIGYDTWTDLAVLKIDAEDLKAVAFGDSELIEIGQDVIAVGSPGGEKFQNSLTKGIVSAVDRELSINKYVHYIQSDAAISPGSSGGPLCNIYGQVIGITTAKTIADYYENMTFSIPSATVEEIIGDLMRYGYVKGRTRIGITGTEVSSEEIYYNSTPAGVLISEIDESGSIAGSKIKEGDIITELDGKKITSFQDIYDVLADHKEGDKISIKVQRPGNKK